MLKLFPSLLLLLTISVSSQTSYYNDVDITLTGTSLKDELSTKIISTHTTNISYSTLWNVLMLTDLDPNNNNNVILIYGYNDSDGNF